MLTLKFKDRAFTFLAVLTGFLAAIGVSVWAATTISTNVTTGGDVYATSTIQATGNILGYGSLGIGTTTPAQELSIVGDGYFTGGLGVGDATTTAGALSLSGNARISGNLQIGNSGTAVSQILFSGTCTVNPPNLGGTGAVTTPDTRSASCTDATGVAAGDFVFVTEFPAGWNADVLVVSASSTGADTIGFTFKNTSSSTVDIGSVVIPWFAIQ